MLRIYEMPATVRQGALLEMARVTKPDGKVVIVDYALPENPIASKVVYHLVKLYERDSYAEFVRSDLDAMLNRAGLAGRSGLRLPSGTRWWSLAKVVIATKIEATASSGGGVVAS